MDYFFNHLIKKILTLPVFEKLRAVVRDANWPPPNYTQSLTLLSLEVHHKIVLPFLYVMCYILGIIATKGISKQLKIKISWKKFWTNLPVVRDIGT